MIEAEGAGAGGDRRREQGRQLWRPRPEPSGRMVRSWPHPTPTPPCWLGRVAKSSHDAPDRLDWNRSYRPKLARHQKGSPGAGRPPGQVEVNETLPMTRRLDHLLHPRLVNKSLRRYSDFEFDF